MKKITLLPQELQPKITLKQQIYGYIRDHPNTTRSKLNNAFPKAGDRSVRRAIEDLHLRGLIIKTKCDCDKSCTINFWNVGR